MQKLVTYSMLLTGLILLTSCASTLPEPIDIVEIDIEPIVQSLDEVEPLPLTAELVYYVLLAEVAGQRGEIVAATELYDKAAKIIDSPALASRSTQIANYTRDTKRIESAIQRWLEVDPDNAEVYLLQLPLLIAQQDPSVVIQTINKALDLAPSDIYLILTRVADNLTELTTAKQALDIIQQLERYQQADPDVILVYAQLAAFYKQYELSLLNVNQVLKQQNSRENALILKAENLQRLGRGKQAMALLTKIASGDDASNDLIFSFAKILGENNKTEQAHLLFEQLHQKLPDNEEIVFALGLLALEEKQGARAKSYFSKLIAGGDPGKQAPYFMGLAEELEQNTDAALVWYASVAKESSRFQASQQRYINLLVENKQLKQARLHLKLLRKEMPNQATTYYLMEADILRQGKKYQPAYDLYSEALELYPQDLELLYGRAMVADALNRLAIFEQDLRKILQSEPDNASVLNALGYTLTDRTNRHQEALALIQRAIELSPDDPYFLDSLGWVYYRMGDLDKALLYLQQAVSIQDDAEFLAHLGEVLWINGNKSQAKRIWSQAMDKDQHNDILNATRRRFGE